MTCVLIRGSAVSQVRKAFDGAPRQAAAARLVAGKRRAIEHDDARAAERQRAGGRGPGRAAADDDDVRARRGHR